MPDATPDGFFEAVVRCASDAIVATDLDGAITAWNAAASCLYGYRTEEAVGRPVDMLWPPGRAEQARRLHARARDGTATEDVETERVGRDGRPVTVSLSVSPLRDRGGEVRGVVAIVRDVSARARDRERLRRSEVQLEEAQMLAEAGSWAFDLETREVSWSRGFFRIARRDPRAGTPSADELATMLEFAPGVSYRDAVAAAVEENSSFSLRATLRRPDGTEASLQLRGRPLPGPDGRPATLVGSALDITESERAREALQTAEARLRGVVDATPALVFVKDLDGVYTLANQRLAELMGRPVQEVLGRTDDELLPPETAAVVRANDREVLERSTAVTFEEEAVTEGDERVWESTKFPLFDGEGRPVAVGGVAVEVTERRRQLDELTRSREQLTEAQRIGRVGSWTWDTGAGAVVWSAEQYRIFGLPPSEAPLPFAEVLESVHPEDRPAVRRALDRTIAEGVPFALVHRVVRPDGELRFVDSRGERVPAERGRIRVIGTARDITAEHEARRRLETTLRVLRETDAERRQLLAHLVTAQEDERRRIAADIHDDSVQAMSAVSLRLETVGAALDDGPRAALGDLQDVVVGAVGRLRTLLFELAPPELGHGGALTVLGALLEEFEAETGIAYELTGKLDSEPSGPLQSIVYRIAQEALRNIRKHAGARRVTVGLRHAGGLLELEVADDGAGFDPSTAARRPGHIGLLSMRHRAELAGGTLTVDAADGRGVRVTARIPADHGQG